MARPKSGGSCMAYDTKSLEELERLASNLREQIRLNPERTKLEEEQLWELAMD